MSISELPQGTVTLLKSGQVISSVSGAVKELIENSLDAGATSIEIRLEDFGFTKLEVKDNGHGVDKTQVPSMVQPHTTSKIREFSDLVMVDSYGFRGEALAALCSVAKLKIRTKTGNDLVASTFTFGPDYNVQNIESQAGQNGTIVTATELFHNLPVRKNFYKDHSRRKEEMRKVEKLVQSFSIINPSVRFSLFHNKVNIFGKIPCENISKSSVAVLGHSCKTGMVEYCFVFDPSTCEVKEISLENYESSNDQILVYMMVPKKTLGMSTEYGRTNTEKTFTFVNKRPVELKQVEKVLRSAFSEAAGLEVEKNPVAVVSIIVGRSQRQSLDANLEPNKQKISLGCLNDLMEKTDEFLKNKYKEGDDKQKETDTEQIEYEKDNNAQNDTATNYVKDAESNSNEEITNKMKDITEELQESKSLFSPDISPTLPKETSEDRSCFTMIGQTQNAPINEKEEDTMNTFSQFFARPAKNEVKKTVQSSLNFFRAKHDEERVTENQDEDRSDNIASPVRSRSPVLRAEMFVDPELPGRDAVYLNRLKDGDFTEVLPEEDLDEQINSEKPYANNSFIQFECEDESFSENKENKHNNQSYVEEDSDFNIEEKENNHENVGTVVDRNAWAKGQIIGKDGNRLEPIQLVQQTTKITEDSPRIGVDGRLHLPQAPDTPIGKTGSLSKKRKLDETTPKIDMFIEQAAKKKKELTLKPKIKTIETAFNIERIKMQVETEETIEDGIIGSIHERLGSIWLTTSNEEVHAMFPLRIKERMIYDRLIASFPLPFERMAEPIVVHPGPLTQKQSSTLLSMYVNTRQCPARITDRRLTFNGFDLVMYGSGDSMNVKLEGRNTDIQYYGLADLQETLDLVGNCSEDSVAKTRPSRVRSHLLGRTRKILSESGHNFTRTELRDLMIYQHSQAVTECPHLKPVSTCLKEINSDV